MATAPRTLAATNPSMHARKSACRLTSEHDDLHGRRLTNPRLGGLRGAAQFHTSAPSFLTSASRRPAAVAAVSQVQGTAEVAAPSQVSPEMEVLEVVQVAQASSGRVYDAAALIRAKKEPVVLVPLLTHFGDLDSWELALKMSDRLPELKAAGVAVMFVGIGSLDAARKFAVSTSLPLSMVYADTRGNAARALGFAPGVGRKGGDLEFLDDLPITVNGYAKLLLMCAGVGSPGTLQEVFRGCRGDKTAPPVFKNGSAIDLHWKGFFDRMGEGYQRPFELATFRLMNMINILRDWNTLSPRCDSNLLVQRGGVLLFQRQDGGGDPEVVWRHDDKGVLGYADVDEVVARSLEAAE
eukprot:CAMPEP_0117686012 /NCGR_PEP_ID=MMETSP0804-20121206/22159_1 /TAXON_ID=1074897 /ORGANISM="Tetraselmis astigmatica, Strain CCMP880" /LENGTH=352 /DNA_ID=CAMNT_0005497549 /DNA_START=133 /DNA_END=1191 /DNA_ORIENTATION=+